MDSLLFLCARCVVSQHPLPTIPAHIYPVIFQVAFLDGRPLALRDLVATWQFPELHLQRLLGRRELDLDHDYRPCIEAIIQGVMEQLQQEQEEPGSDSRCQLRVLDMTGVPDNAFRLRLSLTKVLAKAYFEMSTYQQELQRHQRKRRKGRSGATTATPQLRGVDVHTDLCVKRNSYEILHKAIQTRAASPLRIKCREFQARDLSAKEIVTVLKSLDPSSLRRVDLYINKFGLKELSAIMPHLSRFQELCSLRMPCYVSDLHHRTPESATRIRDIAAQLGMLPGLRELNLEMLKVPGKLQQFLCELQTPLESLELRYSSLDPAELDFLSRSFHAPALKRLDLSGHNISRGFLEPLQLLLEKASASLLYLDLSECHIDDSHLSVLLPTLLRCSRLRILRLCYNPLSMAPLKDLLQKILELPNLHQIFYPILKECGGLEPSDFRINFVPDEERLAAAKAEFSQILVNSGRTDLIWTHDRKDHKAMDYFSL
ncbi:leucine-rich repeat-containing protein 14-like isoform X2 [Catharus ustulatus]|uniref:leucine-rich repeat-containing protein 14-like isoform X2 n=1 Tax=Catharus ustulatus TaxID=91951 RepID=UPI0014082B4C|nr:leucine-rich repeat-containing protein 14-like isoform X2 [Catharus ustulatus]